MAAIDPDPAQRAAAAARSDHVDKAAGSARASIAAPSAYRERLSVPRGWWMLAVCFVATVVWVFAVATPLYVAAIAGVVSAVAVSGLMIGFGGVTIAAGDSGFDAGRAHLEWRFAGSVEALDAAAMNDLLGPGANARAFLLLRSYCRTGVRLEIADPRDPTPYWLISSRHPQELADAVAGRLVRG